MQKWSTITATALLVAGAACGNSVSPEALAGTYDVTVFEFTNQDSTDEKVDLIDLGATITVTITAGGSLTVETEGLPGAGTETGTIEVDGSDVTVDFDGDVSSGTIDQSGDTVTIVLNEGVTFDDFEDGDHPATLRIVMTKTD
jgi:hypothetical protein